MAGLLWYRSYMDSLANTSGYYPDIHAGHADRVTELTLEAPYLIRKVPSGYNQLELSQIIGGTMVVEGSLQSVEATAHVITGKNQFDYDHLYFGYWLNDGFHGTGDPANYDTAYGWYFVKIPVFEGTKITISGTPAIGGTNSAFFGSSATDIKEMFLNTYANGTRTVPQGAEWLGLCIVKNDRYNPKVDFPNAQVERGEEATAYEPYTETLTPLANVTLRGISTTVDGVLSYDGDTYDPDGTVTRYYGERSYQAGDESLPDTVTDGTNTVYKLTTPVTESAAPYTATQTVEEGGTVQFVTSNSIPVGNVSIYRRV